MSTEVLVFAGTALIPLALLVIGARQWIGRTPPTSTDPDAFGDRLYLFAPMAVALLIAILGGLVSQVTGRAAPAGIALMVALPVFLVAIGILVWRPHRLRPSWDDRPPRRRRA